MPRFSTVSPSAASTPAPVKELFTGPLKGLEINLLTTLAHSPAALGGYAAFSGALSKGELSGKEREVVALAAGQANDCDYCLAAHTFLAKKHGLSDAQTLEARRGAGTDKFGALARFTNAVVKTRGDVSDADLAAFRAAGYSEGAVAEVVAHVAINVLTNYFNRLNRTQIDFPAPPAL